MFQILKALNVIHIPHPEATVGHGFRHHVYEHFTHTHTRLYRSSSQCNTMELLYILHDKPGAAGLNVLSSSPMNS